MTRIGNLYGPDVTFLNIERCDLDDVRSYENLDAIIIGAPYDGGTSYRPGTRFGPQAIRTTDYIPHDATRPHLGLGVDPLQDLKIRDAGDVCTPPTEIMISLAAVKESVNKISMSGAIPIVLGGDHSITFADVSGVSAAHDGKNIAVLHFDAHPDTADLELDQAHGHGQWVRRLLESGAVKGEHFIQMGIRGYWPDKQVLKWMAQQDMRVYSMSELEDRGMPPCVDEVIKNINSNTDGLFLSIDVDVCDPAFVPGTGTPEPGGLTSRELLSMVRKICFETNIIGVDIVELCPAYDHADISALLANRVILEALSAIAARKLGGRDVTKPLLSNQ